MAGAAAALVGCAEARRLLDELAGVQVSAKHVERGRDAFAQEPPIAPTMYLGMDGTGVPVRMQAVAGRGGKQAGGEAGGQCGRPSPPIPRRAARGATRARSATRVRLKVPPAATPIPSPRPSRSACGARPRGRSCWETELPGSGTSARSISRVPSRSSTCTHAKQLLWEVARQLHPSRRDRREAWAEALCAQLEDGRLDEVLATLRAATASEEAQKCAG